MNWSAQSIQFVLFGPSPSGAIDALTPWQKLFGGPPQQMNSAHPGSPQLQANASGQVGSYSFTLGATPGRFDLIITPASPSANNAPPLIEDVDGAIEQLTIYAKKLIETQPSNRLSIVANLAKMTPDEVASAALFSELTGIQRYPADATDLAFQMNSPFQLGNDEKTVINRLCRWQTQLVQSFVFQVDGLSGRPPIIQTAHCVGLMLDINTKPTAIEYERASAYFILDALVAEMKKVAEAGYEYFNL